MDLGHLNSWLATQLQAKHSALKFSLAGAECRVRRQGGAHGGGHEVGLLKWPWMFNVHQRNKPLVNIY